VQDFEFTIEEGKVFMLQTRNGKRTGLAAVRFAIEMEQEKLIDWKTAIRRVPADQLDQVLAPMFDRKAVKAAKMHRQRVARRPRRGLRQDLFERRPRGRRRREGRKSAARAQRNLARRPARDDRRRRHSDRQRRREFARGAGGAPDGQGLRLRRGALQIDYAAKTVTVDGTTYKEGDSSPSTAPRVKSIRASSRRRPPKSSRCWSKNHSTAKESATYQMFSQIDGLVRKVTKLQVRTNADTPEQTANASRSAPPASGVPHRAHVL
jgi:pyruvate,orthophosphate dikinase